MSWRHGRSGANFDDLLKRLTWLRAKTSIASIHAATCLAAVVLKNVSMIIRNKLKVRKYLLETDVGAIGAMACHPCFDIVATTVPSTYWSSTARRPSGDCRRR